MKREILGMTRVGYIHNLEIYVNTDDGGEIPHFHVRDSSNWDKFHTCILIESPSYFLHQGKIDILNSRQRKDLDKFMREPVTLKRYAGKFVNNWDLICFLWDINNSTRLVSENARQPDYTKLA